MPAYITEAYDLERYIAATPEDSYALAEMLYRHQMLIGTADTGLMMDEELSREERTEAACRVLESHYGTSDVWQIIVSGGDYAGFYRSDWHTPELPTRDNAARSTELLLQILQPEAADETASPGELVLYYNPNGGIMYHVDMNCRSTHSKYLPFKGSFTWAQINESPYAQLYPCRVCGAPAR